MKIGLHFYYNGFGVAVRSWSYSLDEIGLFAAFLSFLTVAGFYKWGLPPFKVSRVEKHESRVS